MPFSPQSLEEKTYNRCIPCDMRPNSCSGPNPFKLKQPRLGEWIALLIEANSLSYADVAEQALVSEMTVYRLIHGGNINFDNLQRIMDVLWPDPEGGRPMPCPLADQQRFEAIEAENIHLKDRCAQLEEASKDTASAERVAEIRSDAQRKIDHLKSQIDQQNRFLQDRYEFIKQKDSVIDRREAEISECEQEIKDLKQSAAEDKRTRRLLIWLLSIAVVLVIALLIVIIIALIIDYNDPNRGYFWLDFLSAITGQTPVHFT